MIVLFAGTALSEIHHRKCRIVVVPDRKPDTTDQLWQWNTAKAIAYRRRAWSRPWANWWTGEWRRSRHMRCAGPDACADVAPRALCATQRRTGQIHSVVALRIIAGNGGGGMAPRLFPVSNCRWQLTHDIAMTTVKAAAVQLSRCYILAKALRKRSLSRSLLEVDKLFAAFP